MKAELKERKIYDASDLKWLARHWATKIGVKQPQIHIREMRTKWASISTAGRLTLNSDLLSVDFDLAEFVVVHELVHLLAPNHGKVFKSFLSAYLPDWKERGNELRIISLTQSKPKVTKHLKNYK